MSIREPLDETFRPGLYWVTVKITPPRTADQHSLSCQSFLIFFFWKKTPKKYILMEIRRMRRVFGWKIHIIIYKTKKMETYLPWKPWKQHRHESCLNWVGQSGAKGPVCQPELSERRSLSTQNAQQGTRHGARHGQCLAVVDTASG